MNEKVYRVVLHTDDTNKGGDNQNATFNINMPSATINKGYVYVESFLIEGAAVDESFTSVLIRCPTISQYMTYDSISKTSSILKTIESTTRYLHGTPALSTAAYEKIIQKDDIGVPVQNLNLNSMNINIQLEDQSYTALTAGDITRWRLVLLFVDHEHIDIYSQK